MIEVMSKLEDRVRSLKNTQKITKDKILRSLTDKQLMTLTEKTTLDLTMVKSMASIKGYTHDRRTIESWLEYNIIERDIVSLETTIKFLKTGKLTLDN